MSRETIRKIEKVPQVYEIINTVLESKGTNYYASTFLDYSDVPRNGSHCGRNIALLKLVRP